MVTHVYNLELCRKKINKQEPIEVNFGDFCKLIEQIANKKLEGVSYEKPCA